MYLFVERTCNENKKIWTGIRTFANAKCGFSTLLAEMQEQKRYQKLDSVGVTKKTLGQGQQTNCNNLSTNKIASLISETDIMLRGTWITL